MKSETMLTNILSILIFVLILIVIVFIWIMIYDSNRFVISRYTFSDRRIKKNCKIIFLTDLHCKEYGLHNERLLKAIKEECPDVILIGGDMLKAKPGADFSKAASFVQACGEVAPVFYALGNHEFRARIYPEKYGTMYQDYFNAVGQNSVRVLDNETEVLAEYGIAISALSIEREYYKRFVKKILPEHYVQECVGDRQQDCYQILMAHNPQFFRDYAAWNPDLVLAGHVHGGVVRLPFLGGVISPTLRLFPHYDGGLFEEYDAKMILGRGLGMHTIPVRVLNPGELIVLTVTVEESQV